MYTENVMVMASPDQLRKDARRNREAILDAARDLFAESTDVPMCQVARHAGVGQATLYRNFPNRGALAAEILGEHVEQIAEFAAEHTGDPDAFFVLLRSLVDRGVDLYALAELVRDDARDDSQLEHVRRRIAGLMTSPLRDAKDAGTLRRDTSVDDVFLLLAMARGAMEGARGPGARAATAQRVFTLMLDALTPQEEECSRCPCRSPGRPAN